ncbi:MAG: ribosomal protein S18-alanine N-acetyltransferase [Alcanivorax sp.]|mgnify:FL=1|jgi:ribosomal-protein-alanine N-acetyltransferase|nr:MAG: ribosomal-protein-alanine N-acetyltransferase [Oceanobacter sp.]|tara:strand:- start:575 stop:1015 length:441 start_codon:yes stop_codon:yes gene_type:complete
MMRPATTNDLNRIMAIEKRAHDYPWSDKVMLRYLQKPDAVTLLEQEGEHRGHAVVSLVLDEAELLMITVAPEYQGKGLGKLILQRTMQQLQSRGASCMFLEVRESNEAAIALYESLGFCETGRRSGYYPMKKGREDALIYSIELID